MFTVAPDIEIKPSIVQEAIQYAMRDRARLKKLSDYYSGDHDILYRVKPHEALKNNTIVINHAKDIVDVKAGYLVGNSVEYSAPEEYDIAAILDEYKEQTISNLDMKISKKLGTMGRCYEYVFASVNDGRSAVINPHNAIVAYDDTIEHKPVFGVIYEDIKKRGESSILVVTGTDIYEGVSAGESVTLGEVTPHYFGGVPLIEHMNNDDGIGDFEPVLSIIDAYNLLQSDRVNDKEQLIEAILLMYGFDMTDEQIKNARSQKAITNIPEGADVKYLVNKIEETDSEILRKTLEDDIYKISATPNFNDEAFSGNSSGVAIKYKLLKFENSINIKEKAFEVGLRKRFELYNNYLVHLGSMARVPSYDIEMVFKRGMPQNEVEIAQMVAQLQGIVDDETLVAQLPFVENASEVVEKVRSERLTTANIEVPNFGTDE